MIKTYFVHAEEKVTMVRTTIFSVDAESEEEAKELILDGYDADVIEVEEVDSGEPEFINEDIWEVEER